MEVGVRCIFGDETKKTLHRGADPQALLVECGASAAARATRHYVGEGRVLRDINKCGFRGTATAIIVSGTARTGMPPLRLPIYRDDFFFAY